MKKSKINSRHYNWKDICDGWHLVEGDNLSVILEKMPSGTSEDNHYHERARQFFYVLSGKAEMRLNNESIVFESGEGIEIEPKQAHQMLNPYESEVEFLVVSAPKSHGDKIVV